MSAIDSFARVARERIPTPEEFVDLVAALGWRVAIRPDGGASLKADASDPLAQSLARMMSREPYRTGVLAAARERWGGRAVTPREWRWPSGMTHAERAEHAEADQAAGLHPSRATHWRYQGEQQWREVPRVAGGGDRGAEGEADAQARPLGGQVPGARRQEPEPVGVAGPDGAAAGPLLVRQVSAAGDPQTRGAQDE